MTRRPANLPLRSLCLAVLGLLLAAGPAPADEPMAAFVDTWTRLARTPDDHDAARAAWKTFADKYASHDLGDLARLLQAIELLRGEQADKAIDLLASISQPVTDDKDQDTPPSPLAVATRRAAVGLVARARMIQLHEKLRAYYGRHVVYPASLDELVAGKFAEPADLVDPFGQPWVYEPGALAIMPDRPRQTYTLTCRTIDAERRDLPRALAAWPREAARFELSSVNLKDQDAYVRRLRDDGVPGPARRWRVGNTQTDVTLAAIADTAAILVWQQFPFVVTKPE
jgi:hypothetical protein